MQFLIITYRRLVRDKFYTLLCILSLVLGMASSVLISLYLISELSFDRYHQNSERIYRVNTNLGDVSIAGSGYETGPLLVRGNPQFLDFVRVRKSNEDEFSYRGLSNSWEYAMLADPAVFDIFTFVPLRGDLETAFQDPYSIAISDSFARFYFGAEDPIGEILSTEKLELRVTLVFEDLPENVSQQYDALLPFQLMEVYEPDYLENFGDRFLAPDSSMTYLQVANDFNPESMPAISEYFFQTYVADGFQTAFGNVGPINFALSLQNLNDIHFGEALLGDDGTGNILNVYIFAAVAISLLLISCVNYVNLATARATVRVKEVAMRKILGAQSGNLIIQFVAESIIFISLAFAIGIALSIVVSELGYVEAISGKSELAGLLLAPGTLATFILAVVIVGLLTGIYPAFNLSRPSMMTILKPQHRNLRRALPLRQLLVFLQMVVTMIIIAFVFIMLRQTDFLLNTPLGFKKNNQLVVELQGADAIRGREALMTELSRHNEILSVVETPGAMGRSLSISILLVDDNSGQRQMVTTNPIRAGENFLDSMEIQLLQGNMFRAEQAASQVNPVLVNETFVRQMEWDQPLGKKVGQATVIGVIHDFHYLPLHEPIAPVSVALYNDGYLDRLRPGQQETVKIDLIIKITGNNIADTRAYIRATVDQFSDQPLIEVLSLTEIWNDLYADDSQIVGLVAIFAGISIVISLLGLAGLAAYSNQQRSKEIAIRKVLGASVPSILTLLSVNMLKVIALAIFPAMVGAYYVSGIWLERFAYRAEFSLTPYLLAVASVLVVGGSVLLLQTYRTARANPVVNLRYE